VKVQEKKGPIIPRKKAIALSIVLICLMGLTIYHRTRQNIHIIPGDRIILANNFEQLEAVSALTIRATVLPNKETILNTLEDGTVIFGYTETKLKVNEVLQKAENTISDYCFPNKSEDITVLKHAVEMNQTGAKAFIIRKN